jgi:hypothetical protein
MYLCMSAQTFHSTIPLPSLLQALCAAGRSEEAVDILLVSAGAELGIIVLRA